MFDRLAGKVIQQIGMIVVRDIVKINQTAHYIILKPSLFTAAFAERQYLELIGAQMLNPELVCHSRVFQRIELERKRLEPRLHVALGYNQDAWNIDGLLHHQINCLRHDRCDVRLVRQPFNFHLGRLLLFFDRLDNCRLNLRLLQVLNCRQHLRLVLKLANDFIGDLRNLLFGRLGKRRYLI